MEQLNLFNIALLDNQEIDKKIAKTKLGYSALLKHAPNINQDYKDGYSDLFTWALVYRKVIGNLLIELSENKLEATDYLTNKVYEKDREIICDNAFIYTQHLKTWTEQIIDGSVCFNDRILDDCLKDMNGFSKKRPEMDLSVIEDWADEYPEDALNQLNFEINNNE